MACIDVHAMACILSHMHTELLSEIEAFLEAEKLGEHRFGILAANNGRLVERLRSGGRIWPDTEERVREFIAGRKAPTQESAA